MFGFGLFFSGEGLLGVDGANKGLGRSQEVIAPDDVGSAGPIGLDLNDTLI